VVKHQPESFSQACKPPNTFAAAFFHLDHKYKISWECAEFFVELRSWYQVTGALSIAKHIFVGLCTVLIALAEYRRRMESISKQNDIAN